MTLISFRDIRYFLFLTKVNTITKQELTYKEAEECCHLFGTGLARLGMSKGDVLAVMGQNSPQYALSMIGAFKFGIVITPISASYKPPEIQRQLEMSSAKKVLIERQFLPLVLDATKNMTSTKFWYT